MKRVAILFAILTATVALTACDSGDGPAEKMGEKIDNTVNDAADQVEDAADDLEESTE